MKHTLGRRFILCILFISSFLYAEDFSYNITANKHNVYEKEPILLTVDFNQTNPNTILLFRFQVNPDARYKVIQLQAKHDDAFHHVKHHHLYELFPLETGDINITFSLVKRVTDEAKVRYFSSGDRDDFKKLETTDALITLPSVQLHVKALPKDVKLIGDFKLDYSIDKHTLDAFTPVSWKIHIKGEGYPPLIDNIIPLSSQYKSFTEKPLVKKIPTSKGIINDVTYLFALSAKKSYTLPSIKIKAFSPSTHQPYFLEIPTQHFDVKDVSASSLVDKTDSPAPRKLDWEWTLTLLRYLLVFSAGYFTALALRWRRKEVHKQTHPLVEKIEEAKTEKILLQVLMSHEEGKSFTEVIEKLEASLYSETKTPLKTLKKEALKEVLKEVK
jgi:hypothetical protein